MDAVLRRFGPLTALPGDDPAVAIGDVTARHVRLTPDGIQRWVARVEGDYLPWGDIGVIVLELPTSMIPIAWVSDWLVPFVLAAVGDNQHPTPGRASVAIAKLDDTESEWEVDVHNVSGYRRREVRTASELVRRLVDVPEARELLALPTDLVTRVAAAGARRR